MRYLNIFFKVILFSIFTLIIGNAQGQNDDCLFNDPIFDELTDYSCCQSSPSYTVCYDLSPIPSCGSGNFLLSDFNFPGGNWNGSEAFTDFNALANFINGILQSNNVDGEFIYNVSNQKLCASEYPTQPDFGVIFLEFPNCTDGNDKLGIVPTFEYIPCTPINIPDPNEMISNGTPQDLPFINGTAGEFSTGDISSQHTGEQNGPTQNQVGNILNGLVNSGVLWNNSSCININCYENDIINQVTSNLVAEIYALGVLPEDVPDQATFHQKLLDDLNQFFENIEDDGGLAGLVNGLFGFSLPTDPCSGGGNIKKGNEDEITTRNMDLPETAADLSFFKEEIPGLGYVDQGASAPSPSALSTIKNIQGGVDLYNGAQNTFIPLHTLMANDISMPISLNSSNNGLKVNDLGSLVGQNWNLNAGGIISRVVNGLPDEFKGEVLGMGVGRSYELTPRFEILSNYGINFDFQSAGAVTAPLCTPQSKVRTGIPVTGEILLGEGLVEDIPIKVDVRWVPIRPSMLNFNLLIPIFKFWGITISIELGMEFGVQPEEILSSIIYKEDGLGHHYLNNQNEMNAFGLPALNNDYLENLSDQNKKLFLEKIHPTRRFDNSRFLNDIYSSFDAWVQAFQNWLSSGAPTIETERIDIQPDEFYFSAGSYSGKFYIDVEGNIIMTPYLPGVQITPQITGGHFSSFTVQTPEGLVYSFGKNDFYGVDFSQNINYYLPNFYTYPEKELSTSRTIFDKAQIDIGRLVKYPLIGARHIQTYGNTYNRNYKIMDGPRYTSSWHLVSIHSLVTQEQVALNYEQQPELTYYANKSYAHTFPNFRLEGDQLTTEYGTFFEGHLNPDHVKSTKWENGRAEFSYNATETKLERWNLTSIETNRAEKAEFIYEKDRAEIVGDHVCSKIKIYRNSLFYKGWELFYENTEAVDINAACGEYEIIGPPPVTAGGETTFSLGEIYEPEWFEFHKYNFFNVRIGCYTLPTRLEFEVNPVEEFLGYRTLMSEFGSLMEVKGYPDPFDSEKYVLDIDKEEAIFRAEHKRTFLKRIEEIDQQETNFDEFVSDIRYKSVEMPKRFSVHQDIFGYSNDNSLSGSPLPFVTYIPINGDGNPVFSTTSGMALHFPFFNVDAPDQMHLGQKLESDLGYTQKGALSEIELGSGATISFEYELNSIPGGPLSAGLKVVKKVENPGDTPAKTTSYHYENPIVNNLPLRVHHNLNDKYYAQLESKVVTSSNIMNQLYPNKSGIVGYEKVREEWPGIGSLVHFFTSPDNYASHIDLPNINGDINYSCYTDHISQVLFNDFEATANCVDFLDPALWGPSHILKQCNSLFGLEYRTETYNNNGEIISESDQSYGVYQQKEGGIIKNDYVPIFNSTMYQYNHHGGFWDVYLYRNILEYYPFDELLISGLIAHIVDLWDLLGGIATPHPYKYVEKNYQTSLIPMPALNVRLLNTESTSYPVHGGEFSAYVSNSYGYIDNGRENLITQTYTDFSDGISVRKNFTYAFETTDPTIQSYFDNSAVNHLNSFDYHLPVHVKTYSGSGPGCLTCPLTEHSFTALTMSNGKIFPKASYSLQNGTLSLRGRFVGDNGDALPNEFHKANFEAVIDDPDTEFFEPIFLTWNQQRQLTSKTYLGYTSTNAYTSFFEYAGTTDFNGINTGYSYDLRGRLETTSLYNGRQITTYEYTISPGSNTVTAKLNVGSGYPLQVTTQFLDGLGKVKRVFRETDGAILSTSEYDSFWRAITTSALGRGVSVHEFEASPRSELLSSTDAEGNVFQYEYFGASLGDDFYTRNSVIDPNGHRVSKNYNALDLLTKIDQEGRYTNYNYDFLWRLASIANPIGELFTYQYNDMGLVYSQSTPGAGAKGFVYDERYRLVGTSDGNSNKLIFEYDAFDRVENTYLINQAIPGTSGFVEYDNLLPLFNQNDLLNAVSYESDNTTFVSDREDLLLEPGADDFFVVSNFTNDDLGRPIVSNVIYPDAALTQNMSYDNAMNIVENTRMIMHNNMTDLELKEIFDFDDIIRPESHKVVVEGNEYEVARMYYDDEDRLKVKLVGKTLNDKFLQQVDYYHDKIGRIVAINSFGDFECSQGEAVCDFENAFQLSLRGEKCALINGIEIDGAVYTLPEPINPLTDPSLMVVAKVIEDALLYFGLEGSVTEQTELIEDEFAIQFTVIVSNTNASSIRILFYGHECFPVALNAGECCDVPPVSDPGGDNFNLVGDATDNLDLYY